MVTQNNEVTPNPDELIFRNNLSIDDYFIEKTPVSTTICFRDGNGKIFDLSVTNSDLKNTIIYRLIELGVRIVEEK